MHAILIAIGSAGDVFPFIGLARTLKLRGHRVSLCTIPVFRDAVEQHGIAFVPLSDELTYRRTMGDPRLWDPKTSFGVLWQAIAGMIEPVHVALFDDLLNRRFNFWALAAALVAVLGAAIIRYDGITGEFLQGFLLLQLANATFAAGQVLYKRLVRKYPSELPQRQRFGYFFVGALLVALPAWLLFGDPQRLPAGELQWGVLVWMGLLATALGQFWWNKGATEVDAGTLAVMNNLHVPVGLLLNLLIWNQHADLPRLALGGAVIVASLWVNRLGRREVRA